LNDWKSTSRSLAQRIKVDPRCHIQSAGAEFYLPNKNEARFGWPHSGGSKHKCIGIIREAKKEDGIRLFLHLDPNADLIYDPKEFPDGSGKPFRLSKQNESDWDRGEILLTQSRFPDQLFDWISCAIRYTAAERKPKGVPDATALIDLLRPERTGLYVEPSRLTVTEGKQYLRLHKTVERNGKVVKDKKKLVLDSTGDLTCEICKFSFHRTYDHYGKGFAECHHTTPIASLHGERSTSLDDLAIVCANCHRMLHRYPFASMDDLRLSFS
jgi:hypothetical protein